jgi:hypothetical protein
MARELAATKTECERAGIDADQDTTADTGCMLNADHDGKMQTPRSIRAQNKNAASGNGGGVLFDRDT